MPAAHDRASWPSLGGLGNVCQPKLLLSFLFIYIILFKYFNCSFIYINCLLLDWIELLSKGDFKNVNVT